MEVQVANHNEDLERLTMTMVNNYWKARRSGMNYTQANCIEDILRLRAEYGVNSFFGYDQGVRMPRLADVIFKLKTHQRSLGKRQEYDIESRRQKDGSTIYVLRPY